jgi:hypothetical protein
MSLLTLWETEQHLNPKVVKLKYNNVKIGATNEMITH